MDSTGNIIRQSLVVCCTLALLGCAAEKLSDDQKAPQFASNSAGGSSSLALPREPSPASAASSPLGQLLAGLHIKASAQTPADTSLLEPSSRRSAGHGADALQRRFHIKASGQTPADTSLLPRQQQQQQQSQALHQPRRSGPAHVALQTGPQRTSAADAAARQTPANVGLLRPGGAGGAPPRPAAQPDAGVQRQEATSFKQVDGESVRVVVGNYGYESPEGLPVSFKYMSDENGNQASFSIGAPAAGGAGGSPARPGPAGAGRGAAAGAGAGSGPTGGFKAGGATAADGDRKYLPPK